ncbi:MAG: DUF2007 domain-containing protein [Alphaproteobacteria bacterium]
MKELLRSYDPIALSWFTAVLADAGIEAEIFDQQSGSLLGPSFPFARRLMVLDEDYHPALRLLEEARAAGHDL